LETQALLVLTTCRNASDADALATALVEQRLAACVNRLNGVVSTYIWNGAVQQDQESLLLIKTTAVRLPEIEDTVRKLSGYELPEILAVRVEAGSRDYLDWLRAVVAQNGSEKNG
jgi:periplasmic divalent cation tolerance protein